MIDSNVWKEEVEEVITAIATTTATATCLSLTVAATTCSE